MKKNKLLREFKIFSLIILSVLIFRSVIFEAYKIPSGSMLPTLMIGDFILVNKMAYGFKVPFSDHFSDPIYLTQPERPKRGEVIVFKYPKDPQLNYIKRVVGLPGDLIEIRDKKIFINGHVVLRQKNAQGKKLLKDMIDRYHNSDFNFHWDKLDQIVHHRLIDSKNYIKTSFRKKRVPKGHYFVMGDNMDYSEDSRVWGPVPFHYIRGRATHIWFSINLPILSDFEFKFRPWRIGKTIR